MNGFCALLVLVGAAMMPLQAMAVEPAGAPDAMWQITEAYGVLPKATNEEAHEYAAYLADAALMFGAPPDKCMKLIAPDIFGQLTLADWEPRVFHDRLKTIQKRVVQTAATKPNPSPTKAEVQPALDKVFGKLNKKYNGNVMLVFTDINPKSNPAVVCAAWTEIHMEAVVLPPAEGGMMIRWLYAQKR